MGWFSGVVFWGALVCLCLAYLVPALSVSGACLVRPFSKRAAGKLYSRGLDVGLVIMLVAVFLSIACIIMSWMGMSVHWQHL